MTLENPSDHDHPAPHADAQADQQASETKPDMPPAIGMTKPETPPPSKKNSQSQHKEKHWLDYLEAVLGGIGLVVLVVYTIYTALMYSANKNAADAAKSAADTAQETLAQSIDAFRIDERAWIEIEPIKPQLLTREDAKFSATFTCNIFPRNVGKTVATDIVVKAQDQNSAEEFGSNRSEMNSVQDKLLRGEFTEMGTGKPIVIPSNPVPKVLAPARPPLHRSDLNVKPRRYFLTAPSGRISLWGASIIVTNSGLGTGRSSVASWSTLEAKFGIAKKETTRTAIPRLPRKKRSALSPRRSMQ